jgi:DNA-directed RNA polymerase specialized sigma24 family protein
MAEDEVQDELLGSDDDDGAGGGTGDSAAAPKASLPERVKAAAPGAARKAALGASLLFAGLTFLLPLLFVIWVITQLVSLVLTAEALEATDGLGATTFGAGYMAGIACLFGLVVGLLVLKAIWRGKPAALWRKLVSHPFLIPGLLFFALALLAAVLEADGVDLPDSLTTAAFLGMWHWALVLLPIWVVIVVVKWAWRTFKWGRDGPYRAGLVTGLAVGVGLLSTVQLATLPFEEADKDVSQELDDLFDAIDRAAPDDLIDGHHAVFSAVASAVPLVESKQPAGRLPPPQRNGYQPGTEDYNETFGECAENLAEPNDGSSVLDQQIGRLVLRGTNREDAWDIVHLTLILVCEKHASGEVDTYVPYFVAAVRRNAANHHRGSSRIFFCDISDLYDRGTWDAPAGGSELRDAQRAFCALSEDDQAVILLAAQGYSSAEIAAELGISSAAARQRLSRARSRFRDTEP